MDFNNDIHLLSVKIVDNKINSKLLLLQTFTCVINGNTHIFHMYNSNWDCLIFISFIA